MEPDMVVPDLRSADHRAEEENGAAGRPTAVCMCHDGPHGCSGYMPPGPCVLCYAGSAHLIYGTLHGGWAQSGSPEIRTAISGNEQTPQLAGSGNFRKCKAGTCPPWPQFPEKTCPPAVTSAFQSPGFGHCWRSRIRIFRKRSKSAVFGPSYP